MDAADEKNPMREVKRGSANFENDTAGILQARA